MRQERHDDLLAWTSVAAWRELWHIWLVFMPRRSITGRLLWGKVWRRWNGRHWIYKRITETAGGSADL